MKYFFIAVGFPEPYAERADRQYQEVFMRDYAPIPFPGVGDALGALYGAGIQLGIATSNVKQNVVGALKDDMRFFQPNCIYTKAEMEGLTKADAISSAMGLVSARPEETVYVGDQLSDVEAARRSSERATVGECQRTITVFRWLGMFVDMCYKAPARRVPLIRAGDH